MATENFKSELHPLFRAPRLFGERLSIHLHEHHASREQLERIKTLVTEHRGPIPLHFCILCDDGKKIFLDTESIYHIDPTPELIHALELLVGEGQVYYRTSTPPAKSATFAPPTGSSGMKHPLKHYIEYTLLLLFGIILRLLPLRIALLFGWLIALIGYHLVRFRRAEARRRIRLVLGKNLTSAQINKIAWISWRNLCFNAVEAIRFRTLTRNTLPVDNSVIPFINNLKTQLEESPSGVIAATIHMGNWDLAGIITDLHQIPIFSIARRQKILSPMLISTVPVKALTWRFSSMTNTF